MYTLNKEISFDYIPKKDGYDLILMSGSYNDIPLNNPEKTIKHCLSILYDNGRFLKAVYDNLVEYEGSGVEGCYWVYPDMNSPYEEDRFEGVEFEVGLDGDPNWKVQVSEEVAFKYAKEACLRFLEIHPEHTDFVMDILNNWKPSTANNQ